MHQNPHEPTRVTTPETEASFTVSRAARVARTFGATLLPGGNALVGVLGPHHQLVEVVPFSPDSQPEYERACALTKGADGIWRGEAPLQSGDLYKLRINHGDLFPDPASLSQPFGVHGPSQILAIEPSPHLQQWRGIELHDLVIYELHIGTFTSEGTFAAAIEKLDQLRDLGVTAVQVMSPCQFCGEWGWGYDKVFPYAIQNSYGGAQG